MYRTELKVIVYSLHPFDDGDLQNLVDGLEYPPYAERTRVQNLSNLDRREVEDKMAVDGVETETTMVANLLDDAFGPEEEEEDWEEEEEDC